MTDSVLPTCKTAGQGPLVLFLHGLGGNRHAFDLQIDALADTYRCVAWDLPGYSGSGVLTPMTFDTLSASLDRLVEHLGTAPYAIIGHSLGGMVAQSWLHRGGTCDRLVLAQTSAAFGKPGSAWNQAFLSARLAPLDAGATPADFARDLITSMMHNHNRTGAIEAGVATMGTLPAPVYRQAIECLVTFDARDRLALLAMPTLCLAAEFDTTAPPKTMLAMADEIPHASYQCLPDAGHLAYIETPDAFTAAIAQFLAG